MDTLLQDTQSYIALAHQSFILRYFSRSEKSDALRQQRSASL